MRRIAFWSSAALIAYTYVFFPVLVLVRGHLFRRPVREAPIEPRVTILIAARNEEAALPGKLANLASLDDPRERLDVVIVSDGSTDRTVPILREFATHGDLRLEVIELPPSGKAAALNAGAHVARGEVLVFSDANSMYARDAIRALVRRLADPAIGGVAGNQVYGDAISADAVGERSYWGLDRTLKEYESRAGNVIGGTGAIYAIRRELFRPVPPGVNDDFFETAGVIRQGRRLVFARDAIAVEAVATDLNAEYARKVRVVSRAMRCVAAMPDLLNPWRHGFYAIQLFSHKLLRWAMAVPLGILFLASASLSRSSRLHAMFFLAQAGAYSLALVGIVQPRARRLGGPLVSVPCYFMMVNAAALRAMVDVLRGSSIDHWEVAPRPVPLVRPSMAEGPERAAA